MPNGRHSRSFITERIDVKGLESRTSISQETNCHENIKKRVIFFGSRYKLIQKVHKATHQVHCDKSKSTSKSHPIQSRVITKGNHESTDWFDQSRGLFWKLSGWEFTSEMNEWMMKTQMAMKSNQISYLKPMDWARLENFRGERISRSGTNPSGANVRLF